MGVEQRGQHIIAPDVKAKLESIKDPNLSAFLLQFEAEHVVGMQITLTNQEAAGIVVPFARSFPGEPNVLAILEEDSAPSVSDVGEQMASWVARDVLIPFVPGMSKKHLAKCVDQDSFRAYAALGFGLREHYDLSQRTRTRRGYIQGKELLRAVDAALGRDVRLSIRPANVLKAEFKRTYEQKAWEIRNGSDELDTSISPRDGSPQQQDKIPFRITGEIPVLNSKDREAVRSFDVKRIRNILRMFHEGEYGDGVGSRGFMAAILETRQLTAVISYLHAISRKDFSSYDPYPKNIDPDYVANQLLRFANAMPGVSEKVGQDVSDLLQFFEIFAQYGKREMGLTDIVMSGDFVDQENDYSKD